MQKKKKTATTTLFQKSVSHIVCHMTIVVLLSSTVLSWQMT